MKITKPKENQILIEDDVLVDYKLENESVTDLVDSEFNGIYDGLILLYRQPGMTASKQIFYGNEISIFTLISSALQNLVTNGVLDEDKLDTIVYYVHSQLHSMD